MTPTSRKTIPTFMALVLLGVMSIGAVFGANQATHFLTRASSDLTTASDVRVSNVSESGWTVSWQTINRTGGILYFGKTEDANDGVAIDDRDSQALAGQYNTHYVTVRNAHQGDYFYKVGVGKEKIGPNGESAFKVTVPGALAQPLSLDPIYGKITPPNYSKDALVFVTLNGSQPISALSKSDGSYILPLTGLRTADLASYYQFSDGVSESIEITGANLSKSLINCESGNDRPVADVYLGQNYDCKQISAEALSPVTSPVANPLKINNGDKLDPLPTFSGRVGPSQQIQIEVHSATPYLASVKANPDGSWSWTPPSTLAPGQHTVTITIVSADGTSQKITRTFEVIAGSDILPLTSGDSTFNGTASGLPNHPVTPPVVPPPVVVVPPPVTPPVVPPVVPPPVTADLSSTFVMVFGGLILLLVALGVGLKNLLIK